MTHHNDQRLLNAFWGVKFFLKSAKFLISEEFALNELLIRKQQVVGSIPTTGSIFSALRTGRILPIPTADRFFKQNNNTIYSVNFLSNQRRKFIGGTANVLGVLL